MVPDPGWVEAIARVLLALVGVALIAAGVGLWTTDQGTTVTSTSERTTVKKPRLSRSHRPHGAKKAGSRAVRRAPKVRTVKDTTKRTTTVSGRREKGKKAGAPQSVSKRSETVTTTLVGLGAILLLTAGLYRRLSKLKLPGGELEFSAVTRATAGDAAKLTAAAQRKAAQVEAPPAELAAAGLVQLEEEKRQAVIASAAPSLAAESEGEGIYPRQYLVSATSPPDSYYDGVIDRAMHELID